MAEFALGLTRLELINRERHKISPDDAALLAAYCKRRISGEPVYRIIGRRPFWGRDFDLNEETLEPRPETEMLVEKAIAEIDLIEAPTLLDLGTGTGCIPISILADLPQARGVATDLSARAIEAARENAFRLGVLDRLSLVVGSWFDPVPAALRFDVITSNPPYIRTQDIAMLPIEVKHHDPALALDGGSSGLEAYRQIVARAGDFLKPEGLLILEIGFDQGGDLAAMLAKAGFAAIKIERDLGGRDRMVSARRPAL